MNVARIASLRAGVPVESAAVTIQPLLLFRPAGDSRSPPNGSGAGSATAIVAGGAESMSLIPMGGHKVAPNPELMQSYPDVYLGTGLVAENHAAASGISRAEQDAFALRSHERAIAAIDAGRFAEETVAVPVRRVDGANGDAGAPRVTESAFSVDEGRGATPPRRRSPGCGRRSAPAARSRQATRRR